MTDVAQSRSTSPVPTYVLEALVCRHESMGMSSLGLQSCLLKNMSEDTLIFLFESRSGQIELDLIATILI
jgi:hypothetical protein